MRYIDLLIPLQQFHSLTLDHVLLLEHIRKNRWKSLILQLICMDTDEEVPTGLVFEIELDIIFFYTEKSASMEGNAVFKLPLSSVACW